MVRHGDQVDYLGGIYALQSQLGLSVHPGAGTALSMQGRGHYPRLSPSRVQLFGSRVDNLPNWFRQRDWGVKVDYKLTSFLPPESGLVEMAHKGFTVKVSSPARAIMECLYLVPKLQPLTEAFEFMEGLSNLHPASVQELLEICTSVKVKRLFLYLADKAGHEWLDYVKLDRVDLGSGKRAIVSGGIYDAKYQITVPREMVSSEGI